MLCADLRINRCTEGFADFFNCEAAPIRLAADDADDARFELAANYANRANVGVVRVIGG